jgi:hypothetical protein
VGVCCLIMSTLISVISWREQVTFQRDDDVHFVHWTY